MYNNIYTIIYIHNIAIYIWRYGCMALYIIYVYTYIIYIIYIMHT